MFCIPVPVSFERRPVLRADLDRLGITLHRTTNDMLSTLPASVKVAQLLIDTGLHRQFRHLDEQVAGWEPAPDPALVEAP